jgi:hypothetical protein
VIIATGLIHVKSRIRSHVGSTPGWANVIFGIHRSAAVFQGRCTAKIDCVIQYRPDVIVSCAVVAHYAGLCAPDNIVIGACPGAKPYRDPGQIMD